MKKNLHLQTGSALLLLLLLSTLVSAAIALSAWKNSNTRHEHEQKTQFALQRAKEAIIAFAAADATLPGRLPCPEDVSRIGSATEGTAQLCSNSSMHAGRIAWRTLGLDEPRDATGEQLWYVLSPGFRGSATTPINSESIGQLMIDSQTVGAVALIIAPGAPLPGQNRTTPTTASPPDIAQYLDGTNADNDYSFTATSVNGISNDRVLAIYPTDLMATVEKRVANEVRYALLEYYCGTGKVDATGNCTTLPLNGYFPRPSAFSDANCLGNTKIQFPNCASAATGNEGRIPANPLTAWDGSSILRGNGPPTTWFQQNGWRELVYYAVAPACIEGTTGCSGAGYLTLRRPGSPEMTNARVAIVVSGNNLGAASRNKSRVADYFEEQNASVGDNIFTQWPVVAGAFNDQLVVIP